MLERTRPTFALAFVALLVGCGDVSIVGVPAVDAGNTSVSSPIDAGVVTPPYDAGPRPVRDAGTAPAPDAGFADSGVEPRDAGEAPPRDGGVSQQECYVEPFDPTANISDIRSAYRGSNALDSIMEALDRRYPAGRDLLWEERNDPYTGTFIDRSSFGTVMESSMTEVHEATHGWDYSHSLFYQHFDYWLRDDLRHSLSFDVDGFPRSEIYGMIEDGSTDLYKNLYLTGEQGTRGFLELLDETNCYINGLGAIAAIADEVPYGISGRDGAVAFLYYVELYLRRARTQYPQLYQRMQQDAALKDHIKTQWLRTHFFLMFADMEPHVGIRDADIRANLYAPHNMSEISMLIGRCVDQTNCLCD